MSDPTTETSGKIVWFELPAGDSARAKEFYGGLLGWQFQSSEGQDYHMTFEGGGAIYGAEGKKGLLAYFGVDDIEASIDRVRQLGGEAGDKQEVPGFALYSVCTDTEGNQFGLFEHQAA
jgi:predicted enzyme related to lactoylglutathione lyase